jgi:hypothetical protein
LVSGLATLLFIGALILYWVSIAALRRRTGHITMARSEPAFVIAQSRQYTVRSMVCAFAWLAAITVQRSTSEAPWPALRLAIVLLFVIAIAMSCLAILVERPRIELRPQRLGILTLFYRYTVPWDAISSPPIAKSHLWPTPQTIRLNITQPDLVSTRGLNRHEARRISLPFALIYPPVDVAALIDHYLTRPDDRDAIGTRDQYRAFATPASPNANPDSTGHRSGAPSSSLPTRRNIGHCRSVKVLPSPCPCR